MISSRIPIRKILYLISIIICIPISSYSQGDNIYRKHVLFLEAGGGIISGLGVGIERYLPVNSNVKFTLRGAIGGNDSFSNLTAFGGTSILFGDRYQLELGFNYIYDYYIPLVGDEIFDNGYQLIVGFRFQSWTEGLMYRVFYIPPLGCCNDPFPLWLPLWGGVSLGYAF